MNTNHEFENADKYMDAIIGIKNYQREMMNMIQEMNSNVLQLSKSNGEIKEKLRSKIKHYERTNKFKENLSQIKTNNSECEKCESILYLLFVTCRFDLSMHHSY